MALEAKNITCSFGHGEKRETVVEGLSFQVGEGEMVALVGKKRSGKSTVMNVLMGLGRAVSGECSIDGKRLPGGCLLGGAGLRSAKIGVITKTPMLISEFTVYENIMLPLHHKFMSAKNKQRRAKEVLRAVGLKGKGKYYPHELSIFEQQLVCTARALVHEPAYLLADEPTACLEGGDVERYLDLLEVLCSAGKGILIATYSKRVASRCHRIVPITGEEIPASVPVNLEAREEVVAVPGHTLAGTRPLSSLMPTTSETAATGPISEKDALQAILDEQAELSAAEERRAREAYEKDELRDIAIAEDFDMEFEQKLGNHIEGYMQEEQKRT